MFDQTTPKMRLKRLIQLIAEQHIRSGYQNTASERGQLHLEEWESDNDYRTLDEIEMFTDYIMGYALQIISRGKIVTPTSQQVLMGLHEHWIFNDPNFAEWYFSANSDYPKLRAYVELLDYLRLLVIEHITLYQAET